MGGQSYGDSGAFVLQSNGPNTLATWQVTTNAAEPTVIECIAGAKALCITEVAFITDVAGTAASETIRLKSRPRPGTEANEVELGAFQVTVAQMTTVGDVIRGVFKPIGEDANATTNQPIVIPPGQSFVVVSDGDSTGWVATCIVSGYTFDVCSRNIIAAGESIPGNTTKKLHNILVKTTVA